VELQSKFNRVGVLNQLMKGYAQLKDLIQTDATTQAYLAELESHALLPALSADELALYSGDETYIEHPSGAIRPIKETVQAVVASVHALLFGLNHQLKYPKISFTDFRAGDIALFMPVMTENRKIWMAFHASTPYRYLADVSVFDAAVVVADWSVRHGSSHLPIASYFYCSPLFSIDLLRLCVEQSTTY
jgi:hypothetical protein